MRFERAFAFGLRLLPLALVGAMGCNLFNTLDPESIGRSAQVVNPYATPGRGAIQLSLQSFKGCPVFADGVPMGRGNAKFPWLRTCERDPLPPQPNIPLDHRTPLPLLTGTSYVLGQFAAVDRPETPPASPSEAISWFTESSRFKHLDWSGIGIATDEIQSSEATEAPNAFDRKVTFAGAAWQHTRDDTFTVDLLDADGLVRSSTVYQRRDLFVENGTAGHTQVTWTFGPFGPPRFVGDTEPQPIPPSPGAPPPPTGPDAVVKVELKFTTDASKTFTVDRSLSGDGSIRVTWSQLPDEPFYFPVRFVRQEDVPATCYKASDPTQKVPCSFGIDPQVTFSPPENGTFYKPGERFQVSLAFHDRDGNLLHPPDHFPSYRQFLENNSTGLPNSGSENGLLFFNLFGLGPMAELDSIAGFAIAGPLQNMRPSYSLGHESYLHLGAFVEGELQPTSTVFQIIPEVVAALNLVPGGLDAEQPTTYRLKVPENAVPGTYAFELKSHRQFMGERMTKANPFFFQVGQAEPTHFPGRVGNCQLCHRGVISLDNVRHGLPVDFVEGCKTCHNRDDFANGSAGQTMVMIHRLHMLSPKFPRPKNDCATCHLTRESTLRPTYLVCSSCHMGLHGNTFAQLPITTDRDPAVSPTVFSTCAEGCHVQTPPTRHILPER